jgi:hypothetical protein
MEVSAVARVYDRNARMSSRHERSSFLRVSHGDDICIAACHDYGIRDALALCCRARRRLVEAEYIASELHHRSRKRKSCPRARLKEERREFFMSAYILVFFTIIDYVIGRFDEMIDLSRRQVCNVYQVPGDAESWDSPVPGSILGALWLANILHPELMTDTACADIMDEYYETFYHFTYSENN